MTKKIVGRYRALLLLPVFLIAAAGTVVLLNLLLGNVVARRNDFSILRAAGGSASNAVAVVLSTGTFIGLVGTSLGLPIAVFWSHAIAQAIFATVGWKIHYAFDWGPSLVAMLLAGFASVLAGVIPALVGRRQVPVGNVLGS
jgi:ABC-type lipoprotein release transport system permease subunit